MSELAIVSYKFVFCGFFSMYMYAADDYNLTGKR